MTAKLVDFVYVSQGKLAEWSLCVCRLLNFASCIDRNDPYAMMRYVPGSFSRNLLIQGRRIS